MVDMEAERLKMAESLGAIPLDSTKVNPVVEIQRATGERGADVVIECVGLAPAFTTALNAVRAGGTVAVIGVHSDLSYDFPLGEVGRGFGPSGVSSTSNPSDRILCRTRSAVE